MKVAPMSLEQIGRVSQPLRVKLEESWLESYTVPLNISSSKIRLKQCTL